MPQPNVPQRETEAGYLTVPPSGGIGATAGGADGVQRVVPHTGAERYDQLRRLVEENLHYAKANYALLERWRSWVRWQRVWGVVKMFFIVVPLIVSAIYLPPLIQKTMDQYTKLLLPPISPPPPR